MFLAKAIAEMSMSGRKRLENSISDDQNHTSQVSIWTVSCFVNGHTFFECVSIHSTLAQWNQCNT